MTTTAAVTTPATTSDTTSQTRPGALARVARTSVRRRRWVVAAWVLLFVVGIAAGGQLFMRLKDSSGSSGTESGKGAAVLDAAMTMGPTAAVLVSGTSVDDPSTRAAVESLEHRLGQVSGVTGTVDAYGTHDPRLRSADGRETLVVVQLRKGMGMMDEQMAVAAMRSAAEGSVPGATVQVGGDAAVMSDGMTAVKSDLYRGELLALPVLLVALFFVFGGLRAALLPLIAALTTSAGTLLVLLGVTYVTDVAPYAIDVVMLLGLGLAVDYSLLLSLIHI